MAHSLPLGDTIEGKNWCLKALHPSDPVTDVQGIPDEDASPSAHLNYQSTFTLSPGTGATGTWSFEASLLPHPVNFMWVAKHDSTSQNPILSNFLNSQVSGASHFDKMVTFWGLAEAYRMTYMSVTVYQDGPDLANQGTITVCQPPVSPHEYNPSYITGGTCAAVVHVHEYGTTDVPNFLNSQSMPNAYFNNSKFGAYVPLKLTRTSQQWVSTKDAACTTQQLSGYGVPVARYILPTAGGYGIFPFTDLVPAYYDNGMGGGEPTSPMLNGNWAHICARNLAVSTSFTFFVRMGIEIRATPGSLFTTHLRVSPAPDRVAIDNYFRIARELKDGYPADYNDLGKIWDVISSIAKTVGPVLGALGPIGAAVGTGISGAATVGDMIKKAVTARANRAMEATPASSSTASATDKALAKQLVEDATAAVAVKAASLQKKKKKIARKRRL